MSDPRHGLTHSELGELDPDFTEDPNLSKPYVGRAFWTGTDPNPYHLTPAENDISWAGLMELLDEHWPADIFPTREDDPERDSGARIVSLLRWVDRDRAALARVEAVCATAIRVRTERMVEGSLVHIAAKDAIDTFAEAIREAILDLDAPNTPSTHTVRHLEGTIRDITYTQPKVVNPEDARMIAGYAAMYAREERRGMTKRGVLITLGIVALWTFAIWSQVVWVHWLRR